MSPHVFINLRAADKKTSCPLPRSFSFSSSPSFTHSLPPPHTSPSLLFLFLPLLLHFFLLPPFILLLPPFYLFYISFTSIPFFPVCDPPSLSFTFFSLPYSFAFTYSPSPSPQSIA
ncbi:unnamed protein product [Protopolystoma xenopodis]|uniref:Uncharacterized protein n=1 Tax=Protopolystoma xenopodis TaxID=117903 RepID=A0A3S5AUH2_9PLAT|nr:unnamed protein product [Protopolystoma xenopodis]